MQQSASPQPTRANGPPYKMSPTMQAVMDCLEAEENAEDQL